MKKYSMDDVKKVLKPVDAWWTVLAIDPAAIRLTLWTANRTKLHPNLFTLLSILFALCSGYLFYNRFYLMGAFVYELSFLLDCVDGKLASLKYLESDSGLWLDSVSDKIRLLANTLGLACGSHETVWKLALLFIGLYLWDESESRLFSGILANRGDSVVKSARGSGAPAMIRIRNGLRRRRMSGPFSLVDQDTIAFFIAPLFGVPKIGFAVAIAVNLVRRGISILHFWLWRYRRQN